MTKEEILKELGIENSDTAAQESILQNIVRAVEYRFGGIVDDLLDDEQTEALSKLDTIEDVTAWLQSTVPKAAELYESILKDYLVETKAHLDRL